jgi:hypothetical protein
VSEGSYGNEIQGYKGSSIFRFRSTKAGGYKMRTAAKIVKANIGDEFYLQMCVRFYHNCQGASVRKQSFYMQL